MYRALIKCSPVFSFGLRWCDAQEVCGPSAANVHVKEYIFACHCAVQGFTMYLEGYRESDFFWAAPDVGSTCSGDCAANSMGAKEPGPGA